MNSRNAATDRHDGRKPKGAHTWTSEGKSSMTLLTPIKKGNDEIQTCCSCHHLHWDKKCMRIEDYIPIQLNSLLCRTQWLDSNKKKGNVMTETNHDGRLNINLPIHNKKETLLTWHRYLKYFTLLLPWLWDKYWTDTNI